MQKVTLAATQMACTWDLDGNVARAEDLVREAAEQGAQVVLIQELFETPYFCIDQDLGHLDLAKSARNHPTLARMSRLAAELEVVLPISFFEKDHAVFYNSLAMIDADGSIMGVYRKSHIPNAVGYQEKHYFNPGDTGFKVWNSRYAKIGIGICWDQWFPECARCMALMGAEVLMYPSAIGSDPISKLDSRDHWQRTMQGHSAANVMPLVACNRIGLETGADCEIRFFGSSFITDWTGAITVQANRTDQAVITATLDLDEARRYRQFWSLFRDRRPELYGPLMTLDGKTALPHKPNASSQA
jgi:N-carbamoylputrescine amidase